MQITQRNFEFKDNRKLFKPMISRKKITKRLCGNWHFLYANSFMVLLIDNDKVFLVQFGINLLLWFFHKAEIALVKSARAIILFQFTENPTRAN